MMISVTKIFTVQCVVWWNSIVGIRCLSCVGHTMTAPLRNAQCAAHIAMGLRRNKHYPMESDSNAHKNTGLFLICGGKKYSYFTKTIIIKRKPSCKIRTTKLSPPPPATKTTTKSIRKILGLKFLTK
jgi:hypothetical protein